MTIKKRINLGMGILVGLILLIGCVSAFFTDRLAKTFVEYRQTARGNITATAITEDLFEARLAALKYRASGDVTQIDGLSASVQEIRDLHTQLVSFAENHGMEEIAQEIAPLIEEYEREFLSAISLQEKRNELVAVTSALSTDARKSISEVMKSAFEDGDPQAAFVAGSAQEHLLLGRVYFERFLVDNTEGSFDRAKREIASAKQLLDDLMVELQNPTRRDLATKAINDFSSFAENAAQIQSTILARNGHYAKMDTVGPIALARIETIVDEIVDRQNTLGPAGQAMAQRTIMLVIVSSLISVFVGSVLSNRIGRSITFPVLGITEKMAKMAKGEVDVDIWGANDHTEIGRMAKSLEVFKESTIKARELAERQEAARLAKEQEDAENARLKAAAEHEELEKQRALKEEGDARIREFDAFRAEMEQVLSQAASGEFAVRMAATTGEKDLRQIASIVNELMEGLQKSFEDVLSKMASLASGDLSAKIIGERHGAFAQLQSSFNATIDSLSEVISLSSNISVSVADTAAELESASFEMSTRSEKSAASIRDTSTSLEDVAASVKNMVTNAKTARSSTERVQQKAVHGQEVADRTHNAMQEMRQASEQIEKVSGVIEDIAFQINLLALNAGVEAARAGEAGLGFSVVASEVRSLAQRSHEAVSEIKSVIDSNAASVDNSVEQVEMSRNALEEIIAEVSTATTEISQISEHVEEQSGSIEEINGALQSIEGAAQSDAASIEELSASSTTLSGDAQRLQATLAKFRAGGDQADFAMSA